MEKVKHSVSDQKIAETNQLSVDARIQRLNLILRAIRNVNHLLIKVKDRKTLIQGVCESLIETRGYYNAWIALLDTSQKLVLHAEAGLDHAFNPMIHRLEHGQLTDCARKAQDQAGVVIIEDPVSDCKDCPLSEKYASRGAMTVRLEHAGKIYGILSISIPKKLVPDDEERKLVEDLAKDIAFGLHNIQREAERKEMEHIIRIQDKMSSLGRVAAGIAHEIRNPLSGINIYLNTLEKVYDKENQTEKAKQIIEQIKSASQKIESVIRRVMDFSRPSEPKYTPTNINQPIDEAIKLSAVSLRKSRITLEKSLAANLPHCHADPHLIEEMVLNLITNAAEATKLVERERKIAVNTQFKKNRIMISISDSGPGIPYDIRDKILDPFFTTKHEGTGIGLSIVQRIVTDHGGTLNIFSSQWGGAEFRIEIPIRENSR